MKRGIMMEMFGKSVLQKVGTADSARPFCGGVCPEPEGEFPTDTPIGMAYVPFQEWEKPYDEQAALARGTVFPSLDKPFIGEEAVVGECASQASK